jgi:phosphohistidine swiveling domain-containing protein
LLNIVDLQKAKRPQNIGEKARNLHWLLKQHYQVPATYVIPYTLFDQYHRQPEVALVELQKILAQFISPEILYAVRSSANLEDNPQHSFAGQFQTFLNVSGQEELLRCVQAVWDSSRSNLITHYAKKTSQNLETLKLAVILQRMVTPVISGVSFSKNPLTGLGEIVVEALPGSGEELVQIGKTPERWVYRWGNWIEKPENGQVGIELLELIVAQTVQIEKQFGAPIDLEWVFDGEQLNWVQLRPITHLEGINIYSNRISREVFPGQIKPLIWSVNVPLVNKVWIDLFTEMIGSNDLHPDDLAKSFGYRAYFNMGTIGRIFELLGFPRESLELLMGLPEGEEKPRFKPSSKTFRLLPRMVGFGFGKLRIAKRVMPTLNEARQAYDAFLQEPIGNLDETQLLAQIDRLYAATQNIANYNVAIPLLMSIYNALLKWQLEKRGIDFARFNLTDGLADLEEYDPNVHMQKLALDISQLDEQNFQRLAATSYADLASQHGLQNIQEALTGFLNQFGHLSDSGNDFSAVPWRENPDLVLQMIVAEAQRLREYTDQSPIHIKKHFEFQEPGAMLPSDGILNWETLNINPLQKLLIRPIYSRARNFRFYREAVSSQYTYGYGLFRIYFLALGSRFMDRGWISAPEDIFFLTWDEIRDCVAEDAHVNESLQQLIDHRKEEMLVSKTMPLPEIIYGDELPPTIQSQQAQRKLQGIPSSRGYYQGPVKVIRSVADFHKMEQGDVLVIPFSDVSWTLLFTRAGAVIAESGGILSHSSIVAREYNLPCVVSVSQACDLPDHTVVAVDGYKGEILVHGLT